MTVAWSSSHRNLLGLGDHLRFDPGTGPGRYHRALHWLRSTGRPTAVASFTFDPDEAGSVVVAPETMGAFTPISAPLPKGTLIDDGHAWWDTGFTAMSDALRAGSVAKVVLARRTVYVFDGPVDPLAIATRLGPAEGSHLFVVDGLVGLSPELLIRLDGDTVESVALAGTASSPSGLEGDRMDTEHRLAAESVEDGLSRHTTGITIERSAREFGSLVHLATSFRAAALPDTDVMDLVADLHPTAAVAGTPRQAALEVIRSVEGGRGRYAGPVGWFDASGAGEFAIALRCGLVSNGSVTLYAGGGLVLGSDRDQEWRETELKLDPMRSALGLED
jgi:menaquinone-specific isochorismate synthase